MVSRIIKLDSSEPFKWPLFPHRFRSRIFGFWPKRDKNISSFPTRGGGSDVVADAGVFGADLDCLSLFLAESIGPITY